MGYSDISLYGSDGASDLNAMVKKSPDKVKLLRAELPEDNGPYNTAGCVNVALVLTQGNGRNLQDKELVKDTIAALEELVKFSEGANWDDPKNRDYHLTEYRKLIAALKIKL